MLAALPKHQWLATSSGKTVRTPDGRTWVSFDIVQQREGRLLKFAGVDARNAHFECADNLAWIAKVWSGLESEK